MNTTIKVTGAVVLACISAALLIEHHSVETLRAENAALRQQAAMAEPEPAPAEPRPLTPAQTAGLDNPRKEHLELLRLRGEVARLTMGQSEKAIAPQRNKSLVPHLGGATPQPPDLQEPQISTGTINFMNTDLSQVLAVYQVMSGASLDVDDRIKKLHPRIRYQNTQPLTSAEALRQLEEILRSQAGIVVTHESNSHVRLKLANSP
jgi:hypothetical protein